MRYMKKWYLIKTKSKQENTAIINLENQEYTTYCPIVKINKKNVVLFPGYIFIYLDNHNDNWSPIRSTKGVINFVRFGLNYAFISNNLIDFIKANENITIKKIKHLKNFHPGDNVEITEGVFKNYVAKFKSFQSDERVTLLLNLMGQQQKIYIERKSLVGL